MSESKSKPQESINDAIKRLEKVYHGCVVTTRDLKTQLHKVQENLLVSQGDEHRSYQHFTNAKEQYLMTVIKEQSSRLEGLLVADLLPVTTPVVADLLPVTTPVVADLLPVTTPVVAELVEPRDDNVVSSPTQ
jgi:hypothetical protein